MLGQREKARSLLDELEQDPPRWKNGVVAAQVDCARAELAWSEDNMKEAQRLLLHALEMLQRRGAVMEVARVRLRLAELLARQGEHGAANMELGAAESVFQAAGAKGYVDHCRGLRDALSA